MHFLLRLLIVANAAFGAGGQYHHERPQAQAIISSGADVHCKSTNIPGMRCVQGGANGLEMGTSAGLDGETGSCGGGKQDSRWHCAGQKGISKCYCDMNLPTIASLLVTQVLCASTSASSKAPDENSTTPALDRSAKSRVFDPQA